jgi:aspartyl protease family protein
VRVRLWLGIILLMLQPSLSLADIQIKALFEDSAYLQVDGQQKLLREGQSFAGVKLLSVNPERALVEWRGEQQELTLSLRISANYTQNEATEVTLHRNQHLKYLTTCKSTVGR